LRALLEGICQDKRIKGKNLKAKIEGLKSLLPNKNIIRNLHHFRFMGNEAIHELAAPKRTELNNKREQKRARRPELARNEKLVLQVLEIDPSADFEATA